MKNSQDKTTYYQKRYRFWRKIAITSFPLGVAVLGFHDAFNGIDLASNQNSADLFLGTGILVALFAFFVRMYYLSRFETEVGDAMNRKLGFATAFGIEGINKDSLTIAGSSDKYATEARRSKDFSHSFMRVHTKYFSRGVLRKYATVYSSFYVFSTKLPLVFPQIFIDGRGQNVMSVKYTDLWVLRRKLSISNRIQDLEGTFPKRFKVFSAAKNPSDNLRILTPDVMLAIDKLGKYIDIEIINNQVNIIVDRAVIRDRNLDELCKTLLDVSGELRRQLRRSFEGEHGGKLAIATWGLPLNDWVYVTWFIIFWPVMFVVLLIPMAIGGGILGAIFRYMLR